MSNPPSALPRELLDAAAAVAAAESLSAALHEVLGGLQRLLPGSALSILTLQEDGALVVSAQHGLSQEGCARRFLPAEHPRLRRALLAAAPQRFLDPREPDPYEGLLAMAPTAAPLQRLRPGEAARIHACLAARLPGSLGPVGVLTLDALDPRGLDRISEEQAALMAALCGAALASARWRGPPAARRAKSAEVLLGDAPALRALRREINLLGPLSLPVLIEGETGVGKELVAQALHAASGRSPLVRVNCAALPAELLLSELFGHARGAFSGAATARVGRFAAADGGTLLLDEAGELPLAAQGALLRALQEGEVQRLGDDRPLQVQVRVLLATNRDLRAEVSAGRFRADLYHRVAAYPLRVPPLRERREDVPLLSARFAQQAALELGALGAELHPAAQAVLAAHAWPGNVRELRNVIERALLRGLLRQELAPRGCSLVLHAQDVQAALAAEGAPVAAAAQGDLERLTPPHAEAAALLEPLHTACERTRRAALAQALARCGNNAAAAARLLGLSRSFAYKEAVRLGLLPGPRR